MKIHSLSLMAFLVFSLSGAVAQQPASTVAAGPGAGTPAPQAKPSPTPKPGVYDYQELPINDVLRELAGKAKINLVIGKQVNGAVTLHMENKTPLEVIEYIADQRDFLFRNFEGVYYIATNDDWRGIMRNRFYFEVPELPAAQAKYEKRYYDALVKEGFSKDEALKIIMAQPLPPRDLSFPRW